MTEQIKYIPARLKSAVKGGHVTGVEDIDAGDGKTQQQVNNEVNDTLALHQSEISGLNSQNYVTVSTYASLPATGEADTIYRVSSYDGTQVDATKYAEYAWNGSAYVLLDVKTQVGEVFDISQYKAVGGTLTKFADLSAALDGGDNVPVGVRKGGMSVKFVQRSDNKYVQYRLMAQTFTTDVTQWQGVDDEPTVGSENLVKSGGVYDNIEDIQGHPQTDWFSNGNIISGYFYNTNVSVGDSFSSARTHNDAMGCTPKIKMKKGMRATINCGGTLNIPVFVVTNTNGIVLYVSSKNFNGIYDATEDCFLYAITNINFTGYYCIISAWGVDVDIEKLDSEVFALDNAVDIIQGREETDYFDSTKRESGLFWQTSGYNVGDTFVEKHVSNASMCCTPKIKLFKGLTLHIKANASALPSLIITGFDYKIKYIAAVGTIELTYTAQEDCFVFASALTANISTNNYCCVISSYGELAKKGKNEIDYFLTSYLNIGHFYNTSVSVGDTYTANILENQLFGCTPRIFVPKDVILRIKTDGGTQIPSMVVTNTSNVVTNITRKGVVEYIFKAPEDSYIYANVLVDDIETENYYCKVDAYGGVAGLERDMEIIKENKNYPSLLKYKGSKITLIGDSISTYAGYIPSDFATYYPHGAIDSVDKTYWKMVSNFLGATVQNLSYGGSTVTSQTHSLYSRCHLVDVDSSLIIIALGTNDGAAESNVGTYDWDKPIYDYDESVFTEAYLKGLRTLMQSNPNADFLLMAIGYTDGSTSNPMPNRTNAIKTIAEHYGLMFYDARSRYGGSLHPDDDPGDNGNEMKNIADGLLECMNTSVDNSIHVYVETLNSLQRNVDRNVSFMQMPIEYISGLTVGENSISELSYMNLIYFKIENDSKIKVNWKSGESTLFGFTTEIPAAGVTVTDYLLSTAGEVVFSKDKPQSGNLYFVAAFHYSHTIPIVYVSDGLAVQVDKNRADIDRILQIIENLNL